MTDPNEHESQEPGAISAGDAAGIAPRLDVEAFIAEARKLCDQTRGRTVGDSAELIREGREWRSGFTEV